MDKGKKLLYRTSIYAEVIEYCENTRTKPSTILKKNRNLLISATNICIYRVMPRKQYAIGTKS